MISSRETILLPLNDLVKNSSSRQKPWRFSDRAAGWFRRKRTPLIRETIVGSYRLIYRVDDANKIVAIARIWHSARGTPAQSITPHLTKCTKCLSSAFRKVKHASSSH